MVLTVLAESLCGKLTPPTKFLTGFTALCGELISLKELLTAFISISGMVAAHPQPLPTLKSSWGN